MDLCPIAFATNIKNMYAMIARITHSLLERCRAPSKICICITLHSLHPKLLVRFSLQRLCVYIKLVRLKRTSFYLTENIYFLYVFRTDNMSPIIIIFENKELPHKIRKVMQSLLQALIQRSYRCFGIFEPLISQSIQHIIMYRINYQQNNR